MKKKQITATQGYFTDYRDMKFKLTAHRLGSENRNTVLWNKNYRNTAPKVTQYRKPLRPPPNSLIRIDAFLPREKKKEKSVNDVK